MRARGLLIVTAIVSAILGAVVAYLVLTVPNDIQAAALMRRAKGQIEEGKTDQARTSLARIIQQYPRTDAAAAATLALIRLDADDGARTEHELATMRESLSMTIARLAAAENEINTIKSTPPPAPVVAPAPAPKPAPVKKARAKKKHRRR
ncbi:MAG TPA: tetratricopeptide repeat protein [Thermoanaerobaculia bacterium]|jgi:thioredoxin-like negative regulator of GroEL|nr:tetratricopeptide repeat protein [Thermoanaerobaculia bacterium]